MKEQTYIISSHPNPQMLVRWVALIGVTILLLSMLSLWVGVLLIIVMGFALFREQQGYSSWLWHWIPKHPTQIKALWPETTPAKISVQLTGHYHGWLTYGWLIWVLIVLGTVAVAFGYTPVAFAPFLLVGTIWIRISEKQVETVTIDSPELLQITLPSSASWYELTTYLDHHHTELAPQGIISIPPLNGRPLILPTELSEWTLQDLELS